VVFSWLGIDLFANPEALLLLVIIPVYFFWYFRFFRKQRLVIRLSYDPNELGTPDSYMSLLRWLPRGLQLVSIVLLIIAMARPQTADELVQSKAEGIDIMLLMDISGSMEADDFPPNRLEVAKGTAIHFIKQRVHDQIGLILFGQQALNYAPLTLDQDYLARMVRNIDFGLLPRQGTAIGMAIGQGINRLEESPNPSKVMVLLTDGANNRGELDPITAARIARDKGIRIYTIGLGRTLYQYGSDPQNGGNDLDEGTLERIASITYGRYFKASQPDRLKQIFDEISRLETGEVEDLSYRFVQDRYPLFVKVSIILLGISFLLMLTFLYNPLEH